MVAHITVYVIQIISTRFYPLGLIKPNIESIKGAEASLSINTVLPNVCVGKFLIRERSKLFSLAADSGASDLNHAFSQ